MKHIASSFLFLLISLLGIAQINNKIQNIESEELIEPVYGPPPVNLVTNGNFENDTIKWKRKKIRRASTDAHSSFSVAGVAGFTSYVGKITPENLGTPYGDPPSTTLNICYGTDIFVSKGKTYSIRFKAASDTIRNIDLLCYQNNESFAPPLWINNIQLDTIVETHGSYFLNWSQNTTTKSSILKKGDNYETEADSFSFVFAVGASLANVYIDDVEIFEITAPEINIVQDSINITDSTGIYDFGNVIQGESKTVLFTIENTGSATLDLLGENTRVSVTQGKGFSLVSDAVSSIEEGESSTFEIKYEPVETGVDSAIVTIDNNDVSEEVYTFTVIGKSEVNTTSVKNSTIKNPVVNVYPNPATNHIKIDVTTSGSDDVVAEIIDLQGRPLLKATRKATNTGLHSFNWDLKEWNSGIYFVKVSTGSGLIKTCRIILRE